MKAYFLLLSFIGVVPGTLSLLRPIGHKYYPIMTKVTWPDAQNYCRETYADLATVESELDWLRLKTKLAREGLTGLAWIGLYNDVNSWSWSFNDIPFKNAYQHWNTGAGQPDNNGGNEPCGAIGPGGYWWDFPCADLYPFICLNANYTGAGRFVGVTSKLSWNGALAYCREFYTDLAIAITATDNNAMQSIAVIQGRSWIGLYSDTWKWSDGTNTSNLQWLPGNPDNSYQYENCAVLDNGMFEDAQCTELHYFICHITDPVREKQIIKLQVKSDVNMIDSDVQSAILELVKKKLDENGMLENTTVTWRVQQDGQIFRKKTIDL